VTVLARVLKPGLQTTLQDRGRPGHRHLGVPLSGAADPLALALANAAVGNPPGAAGLECTLVGPTLRFEREAVFVLTGADMDATLNGAPVARYRAVDAWPGDRLTLGAAWGGARAYIALAGGLAGQAFLGSVSTYLTAELGGIEGRALRAGDALHGADLPRRAQREIPAGLHYRPAEEVVLRATAGPESSVMATQDVERFFGTRLTVDRRADRMGLRLTGLAPPTAMAPGMNSSAVFPGTVQCPPDGAPFLLLVDAPTTGGYPRLAQVIALDLPHAGQLRPGDRVRFHRVGTEEARAITLAEATRLDDLLPGFSFYC
jgi:biotin-dependent carboxylase-like uncharacterized protein